MNGKKIFHIILTCAVTSVLLGGLPALAQEPQESVPPAAIVREKHKKPDKAVVRVDLPVVYENDAAPFDFHLDPQGLIYLTDAALYGGGTVEEGATLLFHNTESEYDFSSRSDRMTLTNRGDTSVSVSVDARIDNPGEIALAGTPSFSGMEERCAIYLAVVDDNGLEMPLTEMTDVSYTFTLPANDSYAFGLTGACNAEADWEGIADCPVVSVTWKMNLPETEGAVDEAAGEDDKTGEPTDDTAPEQELYRETLPTEPYVEEAAEGDEPVQDESATETEETEDNNSVEKTEADVSATDPAVTPAEGAGEADTGTTSEGADQTGMTEDDTTSESDDAGTDSLGTDD